MTKLIPNKKMAVVIEWDEPAARLIEQVWQGANYGYENKFEYFTETKRATWRNVATQEAISEALEWAENRNKDSLPPRRVVLVLRDWEI